MISEDEILSFPLSENIDSTENPNKAKVRIWVWNEDHIVNSIEVEIPFSQSLAEKPFVFMLKQNYPNPFNSSTVIQYVSLISSKFHLKVYDMTGREVVTLVDGVFLLLDLIGFVGMGRIGKVGRFLRVCIFIGLKQEGKFRRNQC